jgi:dynein heavy chain 2
MLFSKDRSDEKDFTEKLNIDDELTKLFYYIHQSMEKKYYTPRRYLVLLESYRQVYLSKQHAIVKRQQHLKSGVSKLNDARKVVDDLKRNAEVKQKELAVKQHEADEALKQITKSMAVSIDHRVLFDKHCWIFYFSNRMQVHKKWKWNN